MSNRPAMVTQADVQRVIRACQKAGLSIAEVVVRQNGVAVVTGDGAEHLVPKPGEALEDQREVVL